MTITPTIDTKVKYTCGEKSRTENAPEKTSWGLKLDKEKSCNIELSVDGEKELKGTIKIHPLKNEIPIDLTKKLSLKE